MKRSKSFYLSSILNKIKLGGKDAYPSKIAEDLEISKQNLYYYTTTLKKAGCIKKIGYGVWKYLKDYKAEKVKKIVVIGQNSRATLNENDVRGHGFLFKLSLPENFRNWEKREKILTKLGVKFNPYFVGGIKRGQRLTAQKTKVALTDKSIIINFPESFIRETATLAKKDALEKFLRVVKHLERTFRADFSQFGNYKFRVSRQHYSLIKNSLARQYLNNEYDKKKLHVYSGRGLWLLIDNSFNLAELEAVHKDTGVKDCTKVQEFMNGLDMVEGYTPQFIMKALATNNAQLLEYKDQNIEHLKLIKMYQEESKANRLEAKMNKKVMQAILTKLGGSI